MTNNGNRSGLIVGVRAVAEFLNVSHPTIYRYLKMGMPGTRIDGIWFFHKANIEKFWSSITCRKPILTEDDEKEFLNQKTTENLPKKS